jgi:hypothetical protein
MDTLLYVTEHASEILEFLMYLHAAALLIVNVTPTPRDNAIVAYVYRCVEFIAGIITPRAKQ